MRQGSDDQMRANAPGVLVTFEGGDGAGKTTQVRILTEVLTALGHDVVSVREPGGTAVGEKLRSIVLDKGNVELSPRAELLIYEAARAQLVEEVVAPALQRGAIVLCDRFTDSTVAYQGYGRALDVGFVERCNAFATSGIVPDATIMLACPDAATKAKRMADRQSQDRLEGAGALFHCVVDTAFRKIAKDTPGRVRVVRTSGSKAATAACVFVALMDVLPCLAEVTLDDLTFADEEGGTFCVAASPSPSRPSGEPSDAAGGCGQDG